MIPFNINNDFHRNRIYTVNLKIVKLPPVPLTFYSSFTILINITFLFCSRNLQNLYFLL